MKAAPSLSTRRRRLKKQPLPAERNGDVSGTLRLGRRTKDLVKHLTPFDIAVIDHRDIDRVSAEELVRRDVRAVVNVAESSSGTYPNAGPLVLTEAGIPLVDMPGQRLFDELSDGQPARLNEGELYVDGRVVARGTVLDRKLVEEKHREQRRLVSHAIERFADNTAAHMRQETELLAGEVDLPRTVTPFRDRHVLVVVRGTDHRRDLRTLRPYIREFKPVIVAVDGGGDALIDEGLEPDIVIGDMDSASDRVLRSGAELIVHGYSDGRAPGTKRLEELALDHKVLAAPGTSEDVAMLLAYEKGADLIVAVGSHMNLVEFLDKNRGGMSSTFLTRLRVGEILVDTKGVSRLYRPNLTGRHVALLVAAALVTAVVVVLASPQLFRLMDLVWFKLRLIVGV